MELLQEINLESVIDIPTQLKEGRVIIWMKNGDHPRDNSELITDDNGEQFLSEGKYIRRFRRPDVSGEDICSVCSHKYHDHGWAEHWQDGAICPGTIICKNDKNQDVFLFGEN